MIEKRESIGVFIVAAIASSLFGCLIHFEHYSAAAGMAFFVLTVQNSAIRLSITSKGTNK